MNENCLEGVRCPDCGADSRFFIEGRCTFEVTDDGSEAVGNHEWDEKSFCTCASCKITHPLSRFLIMNQPPVEKKPKPNPEESEIDLDQYTENDLP